MNLLEESMLYVDLKVSNFHVTTRAQARQIELQQTNDSQNDTRNDSQNDRNTQKVPIIVLIQKPKGTPLIKFTDKTIKNEEMIDTNKKNIRYYFKLQILIIKVDSTGKRRLKAAWKDAIQQFYILNVSLKIEKLTLESCEFNKKKKKKSAFIK